MSPLSNTLVGKNQCTHHFVLLFCFMCFLELPFLSSVTNFVLLWLSLPRIYLRTGLLPWILFCRYIVSILWILVLICAYLQEFFLKDKARVLAWNDNDVLSDVDIYSTLLSVSLSSHESLGRALNSIDAALKGQKGLKIISPKTGVALDGRYPDRLLGTISVIQWELQ